jgi:hypothetical protein
MSYTISYIGSMSWKFCKALACRRALQLILRYVEDSDTRVGYSIHLPFPDPVETLT